MAIEAIDIRPTIDEVTGNKPGPAFVVKHDLDTLHLRLKLEGFNWKVEHFFSIPEPIIWLNHPAHGSTWFRGWEMVQSHCDHNWTHTYWPKP